MSINDSYKQLGLDIQELQTELASSQAANADLRDDNGRLGTQVAELTSENADLKVENQHLKDLLAEYEAGDPVRWGVASHQCVNRNPLTSVYAEDEKMFAIHDKLGKPHLIRDMLFMQGGTGWEDTILPNMKRHGEKGRTFELTLGNWKSMATYDFARAKARLMTLAQLGLLSGVGGINEPDDTNNGGVNFSMATYAAHQKKIWDMMQSEEVLRDIPVACGALRGENSDWYNANTKFIAANKPYMNEFNWHWYPLAGNADATEAEVRLEWDKKIAHIRANWNGPIYISECGATTGNPGITMEIQAWIDILMLDLAEEDDVKCIIYELACDKATISTTVQRNFGIFNYDGTPRLAAQAIAAR